MDVQWKGGGLGRLYARILCTLQLNANCCQRSRQERALKRQNMVTIGIAMLQGARHAHIDAIHRAASEMSLMGNR